MATNKPYGDGHRQGAVKNRTQTFNSHIKRWVERDSGNGQFKNVKSNATPFKGVRKEK